MTQHPQRFGIQRLIERPGRTSYIRTEELLCPCCGNLTRVEWEQERFNKSPIIETHCECKGCPGYKMTSDVPTFFERFGSTSPITQTPIYMEREQTT